MSHSLAKYWTTWSNSDNAEGVGLLFFKLKTKSHIITVLLLLLLLLLVVVIEGGLGKRGTE